MRCWQCSSCARAIELLRRRPRTFPLLVRASSLWFIQIPTRSKKGHATLSRRSTRPSSPIPVVEGPPRPTSGRRMIVLLLFVQQNPSPKFLPGDPIQLLSELTDLRRSFKSSCRGLLNVLAVAAKDDRSVCHDLAMRINYAHYYSPPR